MHTEQTWLAEVKNYQAILKSFISNYHPGMFNTNRKPMRITAPNVEAASHLIRAQIRNEQTKELENPLEKFDRALLDNDWMTINNLLNSAWFGVPESTDCWHITGFTKAVDLMEDTPEVDTDEP